jgi:hypothetical protein
MSFAEETFTREAREGVQGMEGKLFCLDLLEALFDEMAAEGQGPSDDPTVFQERINEVRRREQAVFAGNRPCPKEATCPKRARALARGGRPRYGEEGQMSLF